MDLQIEVFKTTVETWRYEVDSYWQRNNYFAAFEIAALAGCWYVTEHAHLWTGLAFSVFGILSALIWYSTSLAVLHYVRYWWSAVKIAEGKLKLSASELDFASRIPSSGLHPSFWILCIPILFVVAWITELVFTITRLPALSYQFAAIPQKGGFVIAFSFEKFIQSATLLVLAITVFVAILQLRKVTAQAKASESQSKSSEQMARLSLRQTELMRAQLHASFLPVVEVTSGEYVPNGAVLQISNLGLGPAISIKAKTRGGAFFERGSLSPGNGFEFRFENHWNAVLPPAGPERQSLVSDGPSQSAPLRFEYRSVTGASCWTNVEFPLGHTGAVEPKIEHGMDMPSDSQARG
jgi:hypothetical protein